MKFERCPDCGLMWDRHVRGGHCPHCNVSHWFYAIGGGLLMILFLAAWALLLW